jgi:hypothetical protein
MAKKGNLADALTKASKGAPIVGEERRVTAAARSGKKMIAGFFDPAVSKQLNQIALDHESSVQALLGEAINDLFEKYGKPRIA